MEISIPLLTIPQVSVRAKAAFLSQLQYQIQEMKKDSIRWKFSHNLSFLEGKKPENGGRNIAKLYYFWKKKKSVAVISTGQNRRNIYCRVKKLRKQEQRMKGTQISLFPCLAPLFQLVTHKHWANFRQMPALEDVQPVAMSTKSTMLANRPKG